MSVTSNEGFGFGQKVNGHQGPFGGPSLPARASNKEELRVALRNFAIVSSTQTLLTVSASDDYDFRNEEAFPIRVKNLTIKAQDGENVVLRNLGLILDLANVDNLLIQGMAFHSDGNNGVNDGIVFDGTNSSDGVTNSVRITQCTFDGYKDQAIEIRTRASRLLATIDHCYFFDSNPGGGEFQNRGSINIAPVIESGGNRTFANSYVTVAFNYFENIWRRSPRAAADGTHAHVYNNLLYRWGYQANGFTEESWNGMETELDPHKKKKPNAAVMAVIQANRFIPWVSKQSKAISLDAGTLVDIGESTSLANRFDQPSGVNGNTALVPTGTFQTIDVKAWYEDLGLEAPDVTPATDIDWIALARRAGATERDAGSIPSEV